MNEELTPWFPKEVKPVRKGVYEYHTYRDERAYSYFDGNEWGWITDAGIDEAFSMRNEVKHSRLEWRGLANNPNKKASK